MPTYKTPGVYIQETSMTPNSIAQVETAIPVFIGYTENTENDSGTSLVFSPTRIESILEYEAIFGKAYPEKDIRVRIRTEDDISSIEAKINSPSNYILYYSIVAFFNNGGSQCYIISTGGYNEEDVISQEDMERGLNVAGQIKEITLNVFPEGTKLQNAEAYYTLVEKSLEHCESLKNRFTISDVFQHHDSSIDDIELLRTKLNGNPNTLKYGAVYYPSLEMNLHYRFNEDEVMVENEGSATSLLALKEINEHLYRQVKLEIDTLHVILPPSPLMAGVYAYIDQERGVWNAPANFSLNTVIKPTIKISNHDQERLNVDVVGGKSINAIRFFPGRGNVVWGARTLAGNDNEWRYVNVRRYFNMAEASIQKGIDPFVFEPNDNNTWVRVKSLINNFLTEQWRMGALMGNTPEQAFFVNVGLGSTMTQNDIEEGRMIVEVGIAMVRPAEFIILKFQQMKKVI